MRLGISRSGFEFHRRVTGAAHFLLFDNGSVDEPQAVLEPWISAGVVTLLDCPHPFACGAQSKAYEHALRWGAGRSRWLAFIDIDEFLFSPTGESVSELLRGYERHPGVVVGWHVYGAAERGSTPHQLVTARCVRRAPARWVRNRRVKSIVDPVRASAPLGPHFFVFADGGHAVTERHKPVSVVGVSPKRRAFYRWLACVGAVCVDPFAIRAIDGPRPSASLLRINHYAVRSLDEFAAKIARHQESDPCHASGSRLPSLYWRYHNRREVLDPALAAYAQTVRAAIDDMRAG